MIHDALQSPHGGVPNGVMRAAERIEKGPRRRATLGFVIRWTKLSVERWAGCEEGYENDGNNDVLRGRGRKYSRLDNVVDICGLAETLQRQGRARATESPFGRAGDDELGRRAD
ncbi:hypothetical protein K443DRAFT_124585 [Laccaria amethystina LaAM-08-1]|uniref:Uncharacterized protein n=1 Tax=Laccaria amethystina LaAM-08-1 TaxID=1095629 RepID=A0A0C9WUS4_9AGAR|nr:hypothetical protein K443DRAFT_124585 [Laccaria amethystina LaAM-08-1]